jgi:hypothetical protein
LIGLVLIGLSVYSAYQSGDFHFPNW